MSIHKTTRIPVDDRYVALVGKAVYLFAYYEWTIIWIIESLDTGFINTYSRGKPMTSGAVKKKFKEVINNPLTNFLIISQQDLQVCCDIFNNFIDKRNALIHAHPCTDTDGMQILAYQTQPLKLLPDMKWSIEEVEQIISEIDVAACNAILILDKIRF